jgi:hypothetical protein
MGVKNYSLYDIGFSADYSAEMIEMGIAFSLKTSEDVISKFINGLEECNDLSRESVYASFQPRLLRF